MSEHVAGSGGTNLIAHHFDTLEQQREATRLGMWVFLVTEIMFFGGMFTGYVVYRWRYPESFVEGSHHLDMTLGAINTGVLLVSSYTVALALASIRVNRGKAAIGLLAMTVGLAVVFLGIKTYEYWHKFQEGLVPGWNAHLPEASIGGSAEGGVEVFLALYFIMTGVHALHMVIGVGIFLWLMFKIYCGSVTAERDAPVEMAGLYWHFVDIIWVFLFPMLYLVG
jgi:cytochrome c oxidase subunit 3